MSFSISIIGHSGEKHNAEVQAAVDAAVEHLNSIPGVSGSVSGYSNDGDSLTFSVTLGSAAPATEEAPSA